MLVFAAVPLEVLLLEPLVPHVGQFAVDERAGTDDAKFVIDEIAICRILLYCFFLEGAIWTPPSLVVSKKGTYHIHGNRHFSSCFDSDDCAGCAIKRTLFGNTLLLRAQHLRKKLSA